MISKQAEKVIGKFGGARVLASYIGRHVTTVYKWTYPAEEGGTDGVIPKANLKKIMDAADLAGIDLTPEDLAL